MHTSPRIAMRLPIANIAIPTVLIALILLASGIVIGGVVLALVYAYRKLADGP